MDFPTRTVLYPLHRKLGARMTAFAGFEMPLSYAGIIDEHLCVRSAAGLFDLSHMGEFEVRGPHAVELLERLLTNSAARLAIGQAQYSMLSLDSGGVIDDLIVYRLDSERYMLCVNAANISADREWILDHDGRRADFRDLSEQTALIAIQGPKAIEILARLTSVPADSIRRYHAASGAVAGIQSLIARTGYTGEDGFELFLAADSAANLFEALLEAGADSGLVPCGLGARDTLRLEAGLALYGHELDRETTALEAGLDAFVKLGRNFIGAEALASQKRSGIRKRLIGIRTRDSRSIARQGYKLFAGGEQIGVVTSGSFAPTFGRPLAMAYVTNPAITVGAAIDVAIRDKRVAAEVVSIPFYRRATAGRGKEG